ncbi:MAG: glyceraldehyde 3-phosphate dehydrogenase NAD-binding domain-containing protein [Nannocystaceae bacterium]
MTSLRLGINGLGRVGNAVLRQWLARGLDPSHPRRLPAGPPLEVVAINDSRPVEQLAYHLGHDSVHRFPRWMVTSANGRLRVGGHAIAVYSETEPIEVPWEEAGVDVVLDCSGRFLRAAELSCHLRPQGPKHVILGGMGDLASHFVMGVNEHEFDAGRHKVVSATSASAQAMAPVLAVLDRAFGVRWALLSTTRAMDGEQPIVDGGTAPDLRRTRAGAGNIVPSSSSTTQRAVMCVLPQLAGRLQASSIRVPIPLGAMFEIVCHLDGSPDQQRVMAVLRDAAQQPALSGVLEVRDTPLVSSDIVGDPCSAVVDTSLCQSCGALLRVAGWYDNESAYAARLLDLAAHIGSVRMKGDGA